MPGNTAQQKRDVHPVSVYGWAAVVDGDPTINQHRANGIVMCWAIRHAACSTWGALLRGTSHLGVAGRDLQKSAASLITDESCRDSPAFFLLRRHVVWWSDHCCSSTRLGCDIGIRWQYHTLSASDGNITLWFRREGARSALHCAKLPLIYWFQPRPCRH